MERDEVLKRTDHYRCRRCGQISPITEALCTKPGCRAQLGIYGEIITGEDNGNVSAPQKPVVEEPAVKSKKERTKKEEKPVKEKKAPRKERTKKEEKPVKEKKAPRKKKQKEKTVEFEEVQMGKPFMQKKTLLIWLDVIFLLVYSVMAYWAEEVTWYPYAYIEEVMICVGAVLAITALAIFLARKGKYVLHGIVCILNGAVSFVMAGGVLYPDDYCVPMFLAMTAAYLWLGIISFIGTSKKRMAAAADGSAPVFLKKGTILICLDVVVSIVCCTLLFFENEALYYCYHYFFDDVTLFFWLIQLVIGVLSIVLTKKEKYTLRGVLLCIYGAASMFLQLACSNLWLSLWTGATIAVLHIWLGAISFLKEE